MEKSVATHTEMKDFYGWVHAARVVELPEPKRGETAQQYALRITPKLQERQAQHLGDRLALERERDEALTRVRQLEGGSRKGESDLKRAQEELKKKERELAEKEKQLDADRGTLQQWLDVLRGLRSMSEDDREAFVDIADRALQAGREAREAEAAAALGKGKN